MNDEAQKLEFTINALAMKDCCFCMSPEWRIW